MPAQRQAERQFPVRVRIAVPPEAPARDHPCLARRDLRGRAVAPAGLAGVVNDALAFYFADAAFAHAFVARFCCGYRVETIAGAFAFRNDMPPARHDAPG